MCIKRDILHVRTDRRTRWLQYTSIPFLVNLNRWLKCTIVITRPSSVSRWFFTFRLFLWNCRSEFNETWQDARSQRPLPVFFGQIRKTSSRPSLWFSETFWILWNCRPEFNDTWQEAGNQCLLPSLCFRADWKNNMATLASDWLRHFRLLWNRWTEFNETWQEARPQCPLPSLCFSGRSENQDGCPGLWLPENFSTSLKPLNGIKQN